MPNSDNSESMAQLLERLSACLGAENVLQLVARDDQIAGKAAMGVEVYQPAVKGKAKVKAKATRKKRCPFKRGAPLPLSQRPKTIRRIWRETWGAILARNPGKVFGKARGSDESRSRIFSKMLKEDSKYLGKAANRTPRRAIKAPTEASGKTPEKASRNASREISRQFFRKIDLGKSLGTLLRKFSAVLGKVGLADKPQQNPKKNPWRQTLRKSKGQSPGKVLGRTCKNSKPASGTVLRADHGQNLEEKPLEQELWQRSGKTSCKDSASTLVKRRVKPWRQSRAGVFCQTLRKSSRTSGPGLGQNSGGRREKLGQLST